MWVDEVWSMNEVCIMYPLPTDYSWKDFAAVLLADVVGPCHRHLSHQTNRELKCCIIFRQGTIDHPTCAWDEEEHKKRPTTSESSWKKSFLQLVKRKSDQTYDKGNAPARYLDEGSKKVTDKNVVRTKICHVLRLPVVSHESHHAAINQCWEFVVLENTNQMKTQSEALIWRFGVKNICKRLVFSSSFVLTSCRKSPSNSFFASSSCKILSIRNISKVSLGSRSCSTWQLFAAVGVPPPASLSPTTSWETQEPIFRITLREKFDCTQLKAPPA